MSPEEAKIEMQKCLEMGTEEGHMAADALMCKIFRELGYGEMVDLYEAEEWWYA